MKILSGLRVHSFEEAAPLLFRQEGAAGTTPEGCRLLTLALEASNSGEEAAAEVERAVRKQYGRDARWGGEVWPVPVPSLRFQAGEHPCLEVDSQTYLVASGRLTPSRDARPFTATLILPWGKPVLMRLPLAFLQGLLDEDLERFPILSREARYTSWQVPGFRQPVRLSVPFVAELRRELRAASVRGWLDGFGTEGESLAPLVVGALLGLQMLPPGGKLPGEETYSWQVLHRDLESLGFTTLERQQMLGLASPDLRPGMSRDEALRLVLSKRR